MARLKQKRRQTNSSDSVAKTGAVSLAVLVGCVASQALSLSSLRCSSLKARQLGELVGFSFHPEPNPDVNSTSIPGALSSS